MTDTIKTLQDMLNYPNDVLNPNDNNNNEVNMLEIKECNKDKYAIYLNGSYYKGQFWTIDEAKQELQKMENTKVSKADFYNDLKFHDWYFNYSDDHSKYVSGQRSLRLLKETIALNPKLETMFNDYKEYVNANGDIDRPKLEAYL